MTPLCQRPLPGPQFDPTKGEGQMHQISDVCRLAAGPSSDCACLCLSSSFFSLLSRMKCLKCPQASRLSGSHPVSTIELVERPLGATMNLADI